jgi:hypothetical protein
MLYNFYFSMHYENKIKIECDFGHSTFDIRTPTTMTSRWELFRKSALKTHEFERYLISTEPTGTEKGAAAMTLDSTRAYVMTLPLSYFVSKKRNGIARRTLGKADAMPFESCRIINVQHRGGNAHCLVLIKSRAIKSNPHNISIFDSNGRNRFCSICIVDDHAHDKTNPTKPMKVVTKAYTTISPKFNVNYGSKTHNPGYCGIYGIICVVAFRHYRSKTGKLWLTKWKKMLTYMSQRIDFVVGSFGVQLAAQVQEIIATTPAHSSAEKEIAELIHACSRAQREPGVSGLI